MSYQRIGLLLRAAAVGVVLGAIAAVSLTPSKMVWRECPPCAQCGAPDDSGGEEEDSAVPSPQLIRYT